MCPNNPSITYTDLTQPYQTFLIGAIMVISGGALRLWCYHTLGDLFNFVVHISNRHFLVKTGPYAFARHPSYTGVILILAGIACMCHAPSGYLNQCRITHTPAVVLIRYWQIGAVFSIISLIRRCGIEDKLLKDAFLEQWVVYRRDVPWKILPYVW